MRKLRRIGSGEDDPLDGVANFFDLGLVLALGFMVPLMARLAAPHLTADTAAVTASHSSPNANEQDQVKVDRYRPTKDPLSGEGTRLGVAYRLKTGEVVYIPDKGTAQH